MLTPNVLYRVTGRYMDGQKVVAYHLVGEDGSQSRETKDRLIWLIGKGIISNMRIQTNTDGSIILRGKGINMNDLPKYDENKREFTGNTASYEVANSRVSVAKSNVQNINKMGQYKIVKRVMYGNKCLGYELKSYDNSYKRVSRENVIELASKKLISNAVVQNIVKDDKTIKILRGVDYELNKLPVLAVDNGKIVDTAKNIKNTAETVRAAYMKRNGVIKDKLNNQIYTFRAGQFIICNANGSITIQDRLSVEKEYTQEKEMTVALCDKNIGDYSVEIFGSKEISLTPEIIKSWTVLKRKDTPKKVG